MRSRDFVYWLQGLFELANPKELNAEQTAAVRTHLALVFKHEIDPSAGSAEHQAELNAIHNNLSIDVDKLADAVSAAIAKQPVRIQHPYDPSRDVLRC